MHFPQQALDSQLSERLPFPTGMAFGGGSAIAHRAIDTVFSSNNPPPAEAHQAATALAQAPEEPCNRQAKVFADCMSERGGDLESCRQAASTCHRYFGSVFFLSKLLFITPGPNNCIAALLHFLTLITPSNDCFIGWLL